MFHLVCPSLCNFLAVRRTIWNRYSSQSWSVCMPSISFWVLVSAFLFTLMSLSAKLCTGHFDPFEIVFWRSFFGLSLMTLVMLKKGIAFSTQHPWSHAKRSIAGLSCFILEVIAVGLLPLSIAQSINYTSPLIFCLFFTLVSIIHRTKIDWPII